MNDDWRLKARLGSDDEAAQLARELGSQDLEHDLDSAFEDRIVISVDGAEVFCYAGTPQQAQAAERVVRRVVRAQGFEPAIELARWHPVAERWEAPDASFVDDDAQAAAEHHQQVAQERAESAKRGYPEWEVRIQCDSRRDAGDLSARLEEEGIPNVHRHSWVLVGATDEDSAQELSQRLRIEAPGAAAVTVEPNARTLYDNRPWSPFVLLGGLGG
ncbi:MAG: hypothetical protein ACRDMX_00720 [Solirubrobacteraceae bacterium]